jgi:hypothetical protein
MSTAGFAATGNSRRAHLLNRDRNIAVRLHRAIAERFELCLSSRVVVDDDDRITHARHTMGNSEPAADSALPGELPSARTRPWAGRRRAAGDEAPRQYLCEYDRRVADATRWPVWALIREARRRAGLTQAQLAKRVGTSQPAIARYERARAMPDLDTLGRIVEACGLELRLELAEPDPQREAAASAALARTVEERLEANTRQAAVVHALRHG